MIAYQMNLETRVEAESASQTMMTERLDTGLANCMNLRPMILTDGDIVASRSFILMSLKVMVKKTVPQRRLGDTK